VNLATTLYQGNPDWNHKLWSILSTKRYNTPYAGAAGCSDIGFIRLDLIPDYELLL
jgi:hypothetical protein